MPTLSSTPILSSLPTDVSAPAKPKKLHEAAQQFESLLIGEMLKSARSDSDGWLGSGETAGDDSAMDMAESQLANALASSGGLGLASMVERVMGRTASQNTAETAAANPAGSSANKP